MTACRSALPIPSVTGRDHVLGPENASVTLVEYGDYECSYCAAAHPIVEELLRIWGNSLRFVFRHFPLMPMHAHALTASEAAEAAGVQQRFWEMHKMLYTHQNALEARHLFRYAAHLGLDTALFVEALAERRFRHHVRDDFMSGLRSGVSGTPAFFINGEQYDGSLDLTALSSALKEAMGTEGKKNLISFPCNPRFLIARQK